VTVRVLYFAALREKRGFSSEEVELLPNETVKQLYHRLCGSGMTVAFARNARQVSEDTQPEPGDEIAFLPPVGGG